jgi:hypothetical protein
MPIGWSYAFGVSTKIFSGTKILEFVWQIFYKASLLICSSRIGMSLEFLYLAPVLVICVVPTNHLICDMCKVEIQIDGIFSNDIINN